MKIITKMNIEFEEQVPEHMKTEISEALNNEKYKMKSKELLSKVVDNQLKKVISTSNILIDIEFVLADD